MVNQDGWESEYTEQGRTLRWPSTSMVRVLFGNYPDDIQIQIDGAETSVLDVGCGTGNNLRPFLEAGCECAGVEVSSEIAEHTESLLDSMGYNTRIREGHNRDLPFEDDSFDLLLSTNVIHYEKTLEDIKSGLEEYSRVLKSDGIAYISTVGPEWGRLYGQADVVGPHRYQLNVDDFRNGGIMHYFDSLKYFESVVGEYFETVETGREKTDLMGETRDELICITQAPV